DLHHIGAVSFEFSYSFTNLIGREFGIGNRTQRGKDSWPRNFPGIDGRAQIFVLRRTQALDGSESGQQRDPRVGGGRKSRICFRFTLVLGAAIGAKVPRDVIMNVNPSRQDGELAQIVCGRPVSFLNALNLAILDDNLNVMADATFAVE